MPDPALEQKIARIRQRMAELGHPVVMTSGQRTATEQAKLYAQGRSSPGPVVTNAQHSQHQEGRAADFAFLIDGKPSYAEGAPWELLGKVAKEEGLEWGGDWKSLRDRPHVQLPGSTSVPDKQMDLSPENQARLVAMIGKMQDAGESEEDIAATVQEMKRQYVATGKIGEASTSAAAAPPASGSAGTPGFFSRAKESIGETLGGLNTLRKAVVGQLPPEEGKAVAQGMMNMPKEAVAHPLKTAVRMVGANPDKLWNDYWSGNLPAVAGDLAVPGATILAPKALGAVGGATRTAARAAGAVSEVAEGSPLLKLAVGTKGAAALNVGGRLLRRYGRDTEPLVPDVQVGSGQPPIRMATQTAPGFSPPVPGSSAVKLAKPVDPAKAWAQEAKNLNIRDKVLAEQEAATTIEAAKEGLESSGPKVTTTVKAPGKTLTETFTTPAPEEGAGYLENAIDPRYSVDDIKEMLGQPRAGVVRTKPPASAMTPDEPMLEPPPIEPGYLESLGTTAQDFSQPITLNPQGMEDVAVPPMAEPFKLPPQESIPPLGGRDVPPSQSKAEQLLGLTKRGDWPIIEQGIRDGLSYEEIAAQLLHGRQDRTIGHIGNWKAQLRQTPHED